MHQEVRQTRMKELSESISSQRETIQFLQQQKVKFSNTEKNLEAEINKLKHLGRKHEEEKAGIKAATA